MVYIKNWRGLLRLDSKILEKVEVYLKSPYKYRLYSDGRNFDTTKLSLNSVTFVKITVLFLPINRNIVKFDKEEVTV